MAMACRGWTVPFEAHERSTLDMSREVLVSQSMYLSRDSVAV